MKKTHKICQKYGRQQTDKQTDGILDLSQSYNKTCCVTLYLFRGNIPFFSFLLLIFRNAISNIEWNAHILKTTQLAVNWTRLKMYACFHTLFHRNRMNIDRSCLKRPFVILLKRFTENEQKWYVCFRYEYYLKGMGKRNAYCWKVECIDKTILITIFLL